MRTRSGEWTSLSFALAMAGAILLGPATTARATLTLVAVETGGPTLVAADGTAAGTVVNTGALLGGSATTTISDSSTPGGSTTADNALALGTAGIGVPFGDFTVFGSLSTTNSSGTPTLAQLISSSLQVINNTATTHTITLFISANGFTSPVNPTLNAAASGTFNLVPGAPGGTTTAGDAAHALAFANFSNVLFGTGVSVQDFTFTSPVNVGPDAYANNAGPVLAGTSAVPYSMTVELIETIAGNNELSGRNNSITGVATVPEPATLAMAFSVLPLIGLAAWRKRRKSA